MAINVKFSNLAKSSTLLHVDITLTQKKYKWNKINTRVCEGNFALALPGARNQTRCYSLGEPTRRMMRRTTSHQLMVYLEPVTVKTPFGPAKPARKMVRRRDIYAEYRQNMRLQVAAKVVGRLRGEEFPHFGAACGTRSAWVRRHYTPVAAVLVDAMLHETNQNFPAISTCLCTLNFTI